MGFKSVSKVKAQSTLAPEGKLEWNVELFDPTGMLPDEEVIKLALLYNNLMYDLVGAVLGKLGWEYSRLISGEQDRSTFDASVRKVQEALINE
jgi:hypothetical protein